MDILILFIWIKYFNYFDLKIACIEEIAFQKKYISKDQLINLAEPIKNNEYGKYLMQVLNQNN